MSHARGHTLVYSQQCPNCSRFIDALGRTSAASGVSLVEVSTLNPTQLARVAAVPALVTPQGGTLYGTKAFEWLKQFEADMQIDGFDGENGALAFSDVSSAQSYATYAQSYSAFEPVD